MDLNIHIHIHGTGEMSASLSAGERSGNRSTAAQNEVLPRPSEEQTRRGEAAAADGTTPTPSMQMISMDAGGDGEAGLPGPQIEDVVRDADRSLSSLPNPATAGSQLNFAEGDSSGGGVPQPLPEEELKARIEEAQDVAAEPERKSRRKKKNDK